MKSQALAGTTLACILGASSAANAVSLNPDGVG